MKYREIYEYGVNELKEAGIEEAGLDARLLLEYVCGTDRNTLLVHGDRPVDERENENYVNCIARRKARMPLQHITGVQEFMGLEFLVNEHVLVPRQDTEVLVEEVLKYLHDGMRILDMCTGSGCILLSLLRYSNGCEGVGADISSPALHMAGENAKRLGLPAVFLESSLFDALPPGEKYDRIVSNPPYIPSDEICGLMPEVRDHEPRMALDGKDDGLYFYRRISETAKEYLCRGGMLFFEIGCAQAAEVSGILRKQGYRDICVRQDFAGLDRVVYASFY